MKEGSIYKFVVGSGNRAEEIIGVLLFEMDGYSHFLLGNGQIRYYPNESITSYGYVRGYSETSRKLLKKGYLVLKERSRLRAEKLKILDSLERTGKDLENIVSGLKKESAVLSKEKFIRALRGKIRNNVISVIDGYGYQFSEYPPSCVEKCGDAIYLVRLDRVRVGDGFMVRKPLDINLELLECSTNYLGIVHYTGVYVIPLEKTLTVDYAIELAKKYFN